MSGVAFTGDGQSILASYTSEQIYMFSATEHARPPRAFSATVDSAPHRYASRSCCYCNLCVHACLPAALDRPLLIFASLMPAGQLALRGRAHATTQRAAREMQRQHKPATMVRIHCFHT